MLSIVVAPCVAVSYSLIMTTTTAIGTWVTRKDTGAMGKVIAETETHVQVEFQSYSNYYGAFGTHAEWIRRSRVI